MTVSPEDADVALIFARLRAEVHQREVVPSPGDGAGTVQPIRLASRDYAERLWGVTAEGPFLYKPGRWGRLRGLLLAAPKVFLRKLMRWYVEPAFYHQREFNSAALRTMDELVTRTSERLAALEARLAAVEERLGGEQSSRT